jgi:hypothetical protein
MDRSHMERWREGIYAASSIEPRGRKDERREINPESDAQSVRKARKVGDYRTSPCGQTDENVALERGVNFEK